MQKYALWVLPIILAGLIIGYYAGNASFYELIYLICLGIISAVGLTLTTFFHYFFGSPSRKTIFFIGTPLVIFIFAIPTCFIILSYRAGVRQQIAENLVDKVYAHHDANGRFPADIAPLDPDSLWPQIYHSHYRTDSSGSTFFMSYSTDGWHTMYYDSRDETWRMEE